MKYRHKLSKTIGNNQKSSRKLQFFLKVVKSREKSGKVVKSLEKSGKVVKIVKRVKKRENVIKNLKTIKKSSEKPTK